MNDRREFLRRAGGGLGLVALTSLMAQEGLLARPAEAQAKHDPVPSGRDRLAERQPHFAPKAKQVISIFLPGGLSHVDSFDPKPALARMEGTNSPRFRDRKLLKSPWEAAPRGQSGAVVSDLFPEIAKQVDKMAIIRSVVARNGDHTPAMYQMNTGSPMPGKASVGTWLSYALGTVNQSLPSFVVMADPGGAPVGGPLNWGSGYLPGIHQGTPFRAGNRPLPNLDPPKGGEGMNSARPYIEALNQRFAERHPKHGGLHDRIEIYQLAGRMQAHARDLVDIGDESEATKKLYGLDQEPLAPMGRRMLLAARLAYKYVRFVQVYCGGGAAWDGHNDIQQNHSRLAAATDRSVAALLEDLKDRGMLDETLVLFHTEFGRTPASQNGNGRDHQTEGFSVWMAGAGIKGGTVYGATDELGEKVVQNPVSTADLHATILHLLGLDHQKLIFNQNGRDEKLTDGKGRVIKEILA